MERGDRTRANLVESAASLIRRQGFSATGLKQILQESGASRGSLYFHFPGGKEDLVVEALRVATHRWRQDLQELLVQYDDPAECLKAACAVMGELLQNSGWHKGCPVATITLEMATTNDEVREICAEHFRLWEQFLAEVFRRAMPPELAEDWAAMALASIEGALVLSRAYQDVQPLVDVGNRLESVIDAHARARS